VIDGQGEPAVARGHGVQHFQASADHFRADAVGWDGGNAVAAHGGILEVMWR
jgi:hypothetical protein